MSGKVGQDGTIAVGGQLFFTGLLPDPQGRVVCHKAFSDNQPMLTRDQIKTDLAKPGRKKARTIWKPEDILNQGQHNSCAPYAVGGIIQKAAHLKDGRRIKLAPESTYAQVNGGQDQGAVLRHVIDAAGTYGMSPRDMVKHGVYLKRDIGLEADRNAKRYRLIRELTYRVDTEDELDNALHQGWLVLVAVEVENAWYNLDGNGVVSPTDGRGNHAIHCDDIDLVGGDIVYDHAGSWGTSYGQQGRGYIKWRSHLRSTVGYHEFLAVRTIIDDPDGGTLPAAG